jgi:hypothetical protein
VTVEVLASRDGYLTAVAPSTPTAATLPGVFRSTEVPQVTGRAMVGRTLHASPGSWSLEGVTLGYQWYAGTTPIAGATDPAYRPTPAVAGQPIHVVVTASSPGYTSVTAASTDTDAVLLGLATLEKPTVTGKVVIGRTLTAHVPAFTPATATPRLRWLRGHEPIRGAHGATYVLRPADVGHRIRVEVEIRSAHWVPITRHSVWTEPVRTVPVLHVRTTIRHGRVHLRLRVVSPGLAHAPSGSARAWRHGQSVGGFPVVDGRGTRLLAPMRAGAHAITVVYRGGALETVAQITVRVTVP